MAPEPPAGASHRCRSQGREVPGQSEQTLGVPRLRLPALPGTSSRILDAVAENNPRAAIIHHGRRRARCGDRPWPGPPPLPSRLSLVLPGRPRPPAPAGRLLAHICVSRLEPGMRATGRWREVPLRCASGPGRRKPWALHLNLFSCTAKFKAGSAGRGLRCVPSNGRATGV